MVQSTKGALQERWTLTYVNSEFRQIQVKLTEEPQTHCDARRDGRDEVIKTTVCWCQQLESPEADVIEGLVINAEGLVGVLDEPMHGESGIVGLERSTY